jgi:glycosyltransferase involved in cell wall biosynthesis
MSVPFVSVIVPTYNRLATLKLALRSLSLQSNQEFEVIVVDDGSTDGTWEYLGTNSASHGFKSLRRIRIPHTGLPACARNVGIREARGELVAFLDSDDEWVPSKLERQLELLGEQPSLLGACSNMCIIPGEVPVLRYATRGVRVISFKELVDGNMICNSSVIARRDILISLGLLDEDRLLRRAEDYDMWLRMLRRYEGSIIFDSEPLVRYRLSPDADSSIMRSSDAEGKLVALRRAYGKHVDHPAIPPRIARVDAELGALIARLKYLEGDCGLLSFIRDNRLPITSKARAIMRKCASSVIGGGHGRKNQR